MWAKTTGQEVAHSHENSKSQKCVCCQSCGEGSSFQAMLGLQSGSVLQTEVPETSLEQSQEALSGD